MNSLSNNRFERGISFQRLSLEAEIDQFHLEDEEGVPERPVEVLDSEIESDRLSTTHPQKLIVARFDTSSEEE